MAARAPAPQTSRASDQADTPLIADEAAASSPPPAKPQPDQRQEPPGRTPVTPPPTTSPPEAAPDTPPVPQPEATPNSEAKPVAPTDEEEPERTPSESLYGEDLPPDFWDSDPVADADVRAVTQAEPRPDEVDFAPSSRPSPNPAPREVAGKLEDDPRFTLMQSLFPGQIVEWRDSDAEEGADSDDASEDADGLDLDADR